MTRLVVLLAAVLAAAAAVQGSQATFTASATNNGGSFATAAKFAPTVTISAPAAGGATNDTTPTLSGTAGNAAGDLTTVTVRIYSGTSATGAVVQARMATRVGTSWTTTASALGAGTYTAQATQGDTSGNTGTSAPVTFTIDTTRPTGTKLLAANKTGGTAGRIENGDTITFTYSETITAASVKAGWDGSSTSVQVTFTNSGANDSISIAGTNLGTVATGGNYVTTSSTVASNMVRAADGASIVLTLGEPSSPRTVTGGNMTWSVAAGVADLAGNTSTTGTWTESGNTIDF